MILLFAGIVAGIIIGVLLSLLVAGLVWREECSEYEIEEIMAQEQMSEIERHRAMHLGGKTRDGANIDTGLRRGSA